MLFDDGHYYEILVAKPGETNFTQQQLTFGPFNLQNKDAVWIAKWQAELDRLQQLLDTLTKADQSDSIAYQNYQKQAQTIQEVI